jgi:hypothetical protein
MPKFKVQIKRFEEYLHEVEVLADNAEDAIEKTQILVEAGYYDHRIEKGYDQCYHEITEMKPPGG